MGEIADMMLDGTLCEGCGEHLGEAVGYPQYCTRCAKDNEAVLDFKTPIDNRAKVRCPVCLKRVKAVGLAQHMQAKHSERKEETL